MGTRDAVIVAAARTPIGKRNGSLAGLHAVDTSAGVLNAIVTRSRIDPALVDDVVWACVQQVGEQSINIGRNAVLAAGWPESVPSTTVDRQCGSSQQSVHFAAAGIISGHYDVAVAGGVEMMSRVPMGASRNDDYGDPMSPMMKQRYGIDRFSQGVGAEMMARKWGFVRQELDEYALRSHQRAAASIDAGLFEAEISPVTLADGTVFSVDEGVRRTTTADKLAALRAAFGEDGVITAGNASQISDGASAVLMTTSQRAAELGLTPIARVHTAVVAAADPVMMLSAPIPATAKALAKSGLTIDEIGTYEVNEAFAPVPLSWLTETGADEKLLNPTGGAIALGHPLGASGARILITMMYRMARDGIQYGLQTMCEGGGMANATILEAL